MDAIWILLEEQGYGPYPPAQVAAMLADGMVPAEADVWWPPAGAWVKASELRVAESEAAALQPVGAGAPASGVERTPVPAMHPHPAVAGWEVPPELVAGSLLSSGEGGATAAGQQVVVHPVPAGQHVGRRLPTRPAQPHRHRPHLPAPEHAQHVGGPDSANPWAFTAGAAGVAALAVCWWSPLATVAMVFAVAALIVGAGVLVMVPKGEPGRRMSVLAMVVAAAALVLPVTMGAIMGEPASGEPVVTDVASSPVKLTLGPGTPAKATTVLQAQVFNAGDQQVDGGLFTVEAEVKGAVMGQATQPLPPLAPGASGTARVVFLETLPPETEYRVTKVTTLPL